MSAENQIVDQPLPLSQDFHQLKEDGRAFLQQAGEDKWKQYAWVLLSSNEFAYVD